MQVLLIGGTGNIGTAVTRGLLARGDTVTHFNRGKSSDEFSGKVRLLTGDRDDFAAFESMIASQPKYDCVIDMIAFHPPQVESAIRAFSGRTGQYIFCSTVDVYTKPAKKYPITEDAERNPSPTFPYAFDKGKCERLLEQARAKSQFPFTSIRPAATYQDGWGPIPLLGTSEGLIKRIRDGKPVIVMGDGSSFWVSAHRDDVGPAFVAAAGNPAAIGKGYHVAGEEWLTWKMYFGAVADVLGVPMPELVHVPTEILVKLAPQDAAWAWMNFQYNNLFDNTLARRELGYRYTIPWREGVRRTVELATKNGKIENAAPSPLYDRVVEEWTQVTGELVRRFAAETK
jgi:nucleoside-diphosphate-sugar epimerase